jgi:signal peptidase II
MSLFSPRSLLLNGLMVAAVAGADQWVKHLVDTRMALGEEIVLLPFLSLFHTRNEGVAFSMFSGSGSTALGLLSVAVIAVMLWLWSRTQQRDVYARLGFAFILGGAVGNLIDRAMLGYVTDYVLFHTPVWSFAVFNLADTFITIGAGLVILQELVHWRRGTPDLPEQGRD